MGRMAVGRFPDRAAALDFLVAKLSTKDHPARYSLREEGTARVVFAYWTKFGNDLEGEAQEIGNGADLSAAIVDLFGKLKLSDELKAQPAAAEEDA